MKTEDELLLEANELLRSTLSIIKRKGDNTNWCAIERKVMDALKKQHDYLHQEQKIGTLKEVKQYLRDKYPDVYD